MRKWYFSYDGIMRRPYTLVRISLLANPGKLIQKFFRNFSLLGHESVRMTGKIIHFFSKLRFWGHELDRLTGQFTHAYGLCHAL